MIKGQIAKMKENNMSATRKKIYINIAGMDASQFGDRWTRHMETRDTVESVVVPIRYMENLFKVKPKSSSLCSFLCILEAEKRSEAYLYFWLQIDINA